MKSLVWRKNVGNIFDSFFRIPQDSWDRWKFQVDSSFDRLQLFSCRLLRSLLCFKSLSRFPRFRKLKNLDHCARFSLESWKLEKSIDVEMVATRIASWSHLFESYNVSSVLDNFKAPFRIAYLNRICTNTSNWHWERGTCLKTSSKCSSQLLSWFTSWKLQFSLSLLVDDTQ